MLQIIKEPQDRLVMSTEDSKPSSKAVCEKVPTEECQKDAKLPSGTLLVSESTSTSCTSSLPILTQTPAAAASVNTAMPSPQVRHGDSTVSAEALEKKTFLLFVKILFKLLKEHQGDEFTNKAKHVVMECRKRNQQNHPAFVPLMEALERHLKRLVGEKIWARAHFYLHHYLGKQHEAFLSGMETTRPSFVVAANS